MKMDLLEAENQTKEHPTLFDKEAVDVGGSVPFLGKPQLLDSIMCRQTIGPSSKLKLNFRVTRTDQELRWRFKALKGRMKFTIYREKLNQKSSIRKKKYLFMPKICTKKVPLFTKKYLFLPKSINSELVTSNLSLGKKTQF